MAAPLVINVLRENIKALKDASDLSYRGIGEVGRTINNLVLGKTNARIDNVAAAADGLKVAVWQLFVPSLSRLKPKEREQLQKLVDAFVSGGDSERDFLTNALQMISKAHAAAAADASARPRARGER